MKFCFPSKLRAASKVKQKVDEDISFSGTYRIFLSKSYCADFRNKSKSKNK